MAFGFKAWLSGKLERDEPGPVRIAPAARKAVEPFHAVSIKPGEPCCEGAKQLASIRFLSAKAPGLPLPDCQAAACRCSYAHFPDRRSGEDRRGLMAWQQQLDRHTDLDRRQRKQGRRSTDSFL